MSETPESTPTPLEEMSEAELEREKLIREIAALGKKELDWTKIVLAIVAVGSLLLSWVTADHARDSARIERERAVLAKEKAEKQLAEITAARNDLAQQISLLENDLNSGSKTVHKLGSSAPTDP
ncbi:MAG: hypothetical protein AAF191_06350, partial [Verrucomicrobiota bacterium]